MADESEESRLAVIAHLRHVEEAYQKVFGPPGSRTPYGEVIIADLEHKAGYRARALKCDKTGRFDGGATAYNLGLHDLIKHIHLRIEGNDYSSSDTDGRE